MKASSPQEEILMAFHRTRMKEIGTGSTITINQPVDYMALGFMIFMRGIDITRAIGRVGLKVSLRRAFGYPRIKNIFSLIFYSVCGL